MTDMNAPLPPMNHEEFAASFEAMVERCRDVLITKAGEYADNGDRLQNFTQGAAITGETPEQVLAGYMLKHTLSVYKMLGDDEWYHIEKWYEKIGDHLNYLFLLTAMIEHRKNAVDDLKTSIDSRVREGTATPEQVRGRIWGQASDS